MYKHIHGFLACHLVHSLTFFFCFCCRDGCDDGNGGDGKIFFL